MKKIFYRIIGIIFVVYFGFGMLYTFFSISVALDEYGENEMIEYYGCGGTKVEQARCLFKQHGLELIGSSGYQFLKEQIKDSGFIEDFEKEGNIIKESEVDNWTGGKICSETPETACVPVILKENEILVTPHEYNEFIAEETDLTLLEPYYTDLKTFHKVTGLKEASPEYVQGELPGTYIFDAYTKFYKTKEERETKIKEKIENQTIEEPVVNIDHIDTEEERKERCKDDAMKQFNEIIPDGEFVNLVWEGLEKETRDESGRLTIIHGNFRIVYNKDGYEWFWPGLCETNFVEGNQKVIFNQSYMNI